MRMHAIDAPEMPGACRPGRQCTPGDPYAARDYLRSLTRGRAVRCEEKDVDAYGRMVVRCTADGKDLGCAMVEAGHAVERYGRLNCDGPALAPAAKPAEASQPQNAITRYIVHEAPPPARVQGWVLILSSLAFALMNALGVFFIRQDWLRARSLSTERLPDAALLGIAACGAATGMAATSLILDHKADEQRFNRVIILLAGIQIGIIAGLLLAL